MTIEDLMREQGQLVKKGTLSEDGNLEFWEDGSTTKRRKEKATQQPLKGEANSEVKGIE
jgi:protein import protein ZIM17